MTSDEHAFLYYRSPKEIRDESFTHRLRGLDEDEVREYLDLLADQIEAFERERGEMLAELERLRAGGAGQSEHPLMTPSPVPAAEHDGISAEAAAVLRRAQEVADELFKDASRRAQEIIAAAQREGHEVVRRARTTTLDRMQSLYEELDGEFQRMGRAIDPSAPDRLPPAPPR